MAGIKYFKESVLFQSVLKGNENQYSDIIAYAIQELSINSLNKLSFGDNVVAYREKNRIDILVYKIDKEIKNKKYPNGIEMPLIVIENKLKSIPYKQQLATYSSTLVKDAIEKYKMYLRGKIGLSQIRQKTILDFETDFLTYINNIEWYILSPFCSRKFDIENIPCQWGKTETITKRWNSLSYRRLGILIMQSLKQVEFESYKYNYFKDLGTLLESYNVLRLKPIDPSQFIISFLNKDEKRKMFMKLGLETLHKKFRFSELADMLRKKLEEKNTDQQFVISTKENWKREKLDQNTILVNSGFGSSGQEGLFEAIRKLSNEDVVVLQVEGQEIRKMVGMPPQGSPHIYYNWLMETWKCRKGNIDFKPQSQENEIEYFTFDKEKKDKDTFYYTSYNVPKREIGNLIDLIADKIFDLNNNIHIKKISNPQ